MYIKVHNIDIYIYIYTAKQRTILVLVNMCNVHGKLGSMTVTCSKVT